MSRIIAIVLFLVALILVIRAGQIHSEVSQVAEARKDLLAHFVDHTKTLTEIELHKAQFWSRQGDESRRAFAWYLIGGFCAAGIAQWFDRRSRKAKREDSLAAS
jgi:hypothetical protein